MWICSKLIIKTPERRQTGITLYSKTSYDIDVHFEPMFVGFLHLGQKNITVQCSVQHEFMFTFNFYRVLVRITKK